VDEQEKMYICIMHFIKNTSNHVLVTLAKTKSDCFQKLSKTSCLTSIKPVVCSPS